MKDQKWESADVYALPIEKENFEKHDSVTGENVTISFAPTKRWEEHYDNKLRESGVQQLLSKTNKSKDISAQFSESKNMVKDVLNMDEKQFKKIPTKVRNFLIILVSKSKMSKEELSDICKDY